MTNDPFRRPNDGQPRDRTLSSIQTPRLPGLRRLTVSIILILLGLFLVLFLYSKMIRVSPVRPRVVNMADTDGGTLGSMDAEAVKSIHGVTVNKARDGTRTERLHDLIKAIGAGVPIQFILGDAGVQGVIIQSKNADRTALLIKAYEDIGSLEKEVSALKQKNLKMERRNSKLREELRELREPKTQHTKTSSSL